MRNIDNLNFGDIVIANLPYSDGSNSKIRPVLILTRDGTDYLLMKISSILNKKESCDMQIVPDEINSLEEASVFKTKKISHLSKEILLKKIGELTDKHQRMIKDKLIHLVKSF